MSIGMLGCSSGSDRSAPGSSGAPSTAATDDDPVGAVTLIPMPAAVTLGSGHLLLADGADTLDPEVSLDPTATDLGEEGYRLDVDGEGIRIVATTDAGAFYATQTLRQLVEPGGGDSPARVPFVAIVDQPRFEWRGFMVDVSRHFFDVDVIKKQIDVLSRYKINRLHLHLTDDQGWRIQIDSWPELTATGAAIDISGEGPGGFFTPADLADITTYAANRFMTVVPEIDMPGHVNAALASYGELSDDGIPTDLVGVVPFGQSALSLDAPATPRFIEEVIAEVAAQTPGPYIHIGGDEALSLDRDDYVGLVTLAADAVQANGKIPIGWDEAESAGLSDTLITQYWLDPDRAQRAATAGSKVIVSRANRAYLDQGYDDTTPLGLSWAGFIDVDTAYDWDPTDEGLTDDQILGVEAPLWTETIATEADLEYMLFPRILGYAEIGWTPQSARSWDDYRSRLAAHGPRLAELGVSFFASPVVEWPSDSMPDEAE